MAGSDEAQAGVRKAQVAVARKLGEAERRWLTTRGNSESDRLIAVLGEALILAHADIWYGHADTSIFESTDIPDDRASSDTFASRLSEKLLGKVAEGILLALPAVVVPLLPKLTS
jgi:hypothetical protein